MYYNLFCECDIHGVILKTGDDRLTNACMSDGEVDAQIKLLKESIDKMVPEMKKIIRDNEGKPLWLDDSN